MEEYLPEHVKWVGCKGSEPRFRGYPCGMWTLFHTLTVAAFQKEQASEYSFVISGYLNMGRYMSIKHKFITFFSRENASDNLVI
jgi:thiol oxidase